jgi:arabinan endo-1,5-alpha-L-arabinosidase
MDVYPRFLVCCIGVMILLGSCKAYPPELEAFYTHTWGDSAKSEAVFTQDFPDPDLIEIDGTYYAFATIAMGRNIQVASSKDLINWNWLEDALPSLPAWSSKGDTWAPDVTASPDGNGYHMYYVTHHKKLYRQCIDLAFSKKPEGPYQSSSTEPLVCQTEEGGSIDPAFFKDKTGKQYLLWKNDGNCCGLPTWIYIQELSEDGRSLTGSSQQLITTSLDWEGDLIEAPTLFMHEGKYYLFYSANAYYDGRYATGVAISDNIFGPYVKVEQPILSTGLGGSAWYGPGGQDIFIGPDHNTYIAFHGWDKFYIRRKLYVERLYWQDGVPSLLKVN